MTPLSDKKRREGVPGEGVHSLPGILEARGLRSGYGAAPVLHGIDLVIRPGEAIGLMGRNGMGKTTLLRTLMGLVRATGGSVHADGADITQEAPFRRARRGIAMVPEGRGVFTGLTVLENLRLAARPGTDWPEARVLGLFPRLAERRLHLGGQLSGGEQQMLAIGRALMTGPRLLILDEATEGLAPLLRDAIWKTIATVRAAGVATIVVDRTVDAVLSLVDRAEVVVKGAIVWSGPPAALRADPETMHRHLGV
jgi:branched-chain amino acid transport system ATP-binding protein